MSEQTSNPTSGQSVPKSRKSKFRQKSQQQKTAESKLRMERRGEKLDAARKKLAKQKPLKPKGPVRRVAGVAGRGAGAALPVWRIFRAIGYAQHHR